MDTETRTWNGLGILVALITASIPAWITWHVYELGGIPEKSVGIQYIGPISPLDGLAPLGKGKSVALSVGDKAYDSLAIQQFILTNDGKAPVVATDFFEPLRVTSKEPWEIVSILAGGAQSFNIEWNQRTPNKFEAKPFLLNPGDQVWQTVYLTRHPGTAETPDASAKPDITVTARVVNLKAFTVKTSLIERATASGQAIVYLPLHSVLVLLFIASIFLYWYAWSIQKSGIAIFPSKRALILLVIFAILSYSMAEVVTYYMFGGRNELLEEMLGQHLLEWRFQIQNWIVILLHVGISVYLFRRIRKRQSS